MTTHVMPLEGRVCLVVGGVQALGHVIAVSLIESGATVVATTSRHGHSTTDTPTVHLDVLDVESVRAAMDHIAREYGRLDVLVYNSGLPGPAKPLDDITDDEWDEALSVNLTGFFRVCRAGLPLLRQANGGGRIIVISSITARRPLLHRVSYAATKSALTGMVRSFALELGPDNITVNAISPGYVEGERLQRVIGDQARAHGMSFDQMQERFASHSPLGHLVDPTSIGRAVVFLADTMSGDMTGIDLNISAGVWMD